MDVAPHTGESARQPPREYTRPGPAAARRGAWDGAPVKPAAPRSRTITPYRWTEPTEETREMNTQAYIRIHALLATIGLAPAGDPLPALAGWRRTRA